MAEGLDFQPAKTRKGIDLFLQYSKPSSVKKSNIKLFPQEHNILQPVFPHHLRKKREDVKSNTTLQPTIFRCRQPPFSEKDTLPLPSEEDAKKTHPPPPPRGCEERGKQLEAFLTLRKETFFGPEKEEEEKGWEREEEEGWG